MRPISNLFNHSFAFLIICCLLFVLVLPVSLLAASPTAQPMSAIWETGRSLNGNLLFSHILDLQVAVHNNTIGVAWVASLQGSPDDYGIYFSRSADGGLSWSDGARIADISTPFVGMALTIGNDESIHLTYVYNRPYPVDDEVRVMTSRDGGVIWAESTPITPEPYRWSMRRPQIASNPDTGELYLTWVEGSNSMFLMSSQSADGGMSWSGKTEVFVSNWEEWGGGHQLVTAGNGVVYMTTNTTATAMIFKSGDGGQTWSQLTPPANVDYSLAIATDGPDRVYLIGKDEEYPDNNALYTSGDGGNSWSGTVMPVPVTTVAARGGGQLAAISSGGIIESGDDGQTWSAPVILGIIEVESALATDPVSGSAAAVWRDSGNMVWATASGGTPPPPAAVNVEIFDAQGNPVTALAKNGEGWPTPNPLEVRMTFTNTTSAALLDPMLVLNVNSPFVSGSSTEREGRFYVLEENGFGGENVFPNSDQYANTVQPGAMTPGQVKVISATLWVQPSVTTTLTIGANFYTGTLTLPGAVSVPIGYAEASVAVSLAQIHPVVLMPGYLASFPPGPDGLPDPLNQTYDNMLAALKQAGYEPGPIVPAEYSPLHAGSGATLLVFGYDWRVPLGQTGQMAVKEYIDRIVNTPVEYRKPYVNYDQVTIVAHSTGGLIARAYIENSEANKNTVNKLITLGTPNEGTLAAYRAWYGGDPTGILPDIGMFRQLLGVFAWCEGNSIQYTTGSLPELYALKTKDYYNYFRMRSPSAADFMPRADYVQSPYLVAKPVSSVPTLCGIQATSYDYCFEKPPSDFLDDLNTPDGLFDVTRLNDPDLPIISAYSSAYDTDGVYNVSHPSFPPPPSVFPQPEFWKYGEVANIPQDIVFVDGDRLVPEFSADLTRIAAYTNIITTSETNNDPETPLWHMSLNYDPVMVRRIVSYVTDVPEANIHTSFWTTPYNQYAFDGWEIAAIASCSPVRLIATDPLGRQAGLDLTSGQIINQIPGAFVSADGTDPQIIMFPAVEGQYQVQGLGIEEGSYKIGALLSVTQTESIVVVSEQTGTTTIGQDYGFTFDTRIPPVAAFWTAPLTGTVPLTVTFTNETAGVADSYLWNYGDGQGELLTTSVGPTHTYIEPGLYNVSLTVDGEYGTHTFTRTGYISVTGVSTPDPTPTVTPANTATVEPTPTGTPTPDATATPTTAPTTEPTPTATITPGSVTIDGLITAFDGYCAEIQQLDPQTQGICNDLRWKLTTAQDYIQQGQNADAIEKLEMFISAVEAVKQQYASVEGVAEVADQFIGMAGQIIAQLSEPVPTGTATPTPTATPTGTATATTVPTAEPTPTATTTPGSVTIDGLITAFDGYCAEIQQLDPQMQGICNDLRWKLTTARDYIQQGQNADAIEKLEMFISAVEAVKQQYASIEGLTEAADQLIGMAEQIIAQLQG